MAPVEEPIELAHLRDAQRGVDVGQPVVVTERLDLVVPLTSLRLANDAVRAEAAQAFGESRRVRRDRAAFGRRDRLDRMKGERRHGTVGAAADRAVGRWV